MENTKHLDLKQWELEDFILMEDFNADNQKVDAAFATLQQGQQQAAEQLQQLQAGLALQKLGTAVGDGSNSLQMDLSGVDLTQYSRLYLHLSVNGLAAGIRLFFSDSFTATGGLSLGTAAGGGYICQMQVAPLQEGFFYEYVSCNSDNTQGSHAAYSTLVTPDAMDTLYLAAYNNGKWLTFNENCRATLYGWAW